ncbi:MAG TPA: transglycosylase domain-containing protein [Ramlibacter sp.]|nr:transglycosylase domain-containing protein [Ramlibacter sp.]
MKSAIEGVMNRAAGAARRVGGAIRRHPWRALLALPLAAAAYVVVLYPFTPSIGDIRKSKQEQPSVVLSADGKELAVFKRANRDWVKLEDISPKVVDALLATEDKRFYEHHGIDFIRTGKAVVNTLMGDVEGGSTLTQQLARNLYPEEIGREQTVTRKVKEAITALKIEAIYSKDEILETYLNSVSFLYNAWGIEMAARTYFDKPAKKLNEVEAATLVGMLKGTSYYNPVINPERALQRRNTVLAMMAEEDKLPAGQYERLKAQPMKLNFERVQEFNGSAPHLAEYLRKWLIDWADRNDYNIYADGLVVRTTIDSRLQQMANRAVERQGEALQAVADVEWSRSGLAALGSDPAAYVSRASGVKAFEYFWNSNPKLVRSWIRDTEEFRTAREEGKSEEEALKALQEDAGFMADLRRRKTTLQAGFLALDPMTGAVKAWVGSRDYAEDKFDHVQQARRQPGSTFKPFVYGAAFQMGIPANETFVDAPVSIQIDKNKFWRPSDVGSGPTGQPMTLREGLARSKNTITAQLMMRVGPSSVARLARAMGVRESKLEEVPSLALGTSPVTLREMVAAFGTIANGGSYMEPQIVTAVEDRSGRVLQAFSGPAPESALSADAANTLLDVLRGTVDGGTAAGLKPRFGLSGDLAGKTGTTQDNTDGWFILMHPRLVAGAWMGFNDNRVRMRSEYWGQGGHNALLVVGDFMRQSTQAGLVDSKATFAAPRMKDTAPPLVDRMGDWWNNVFNTAPSSQDTEVAAVPEVQLPPVNLEPPVLEPPPPALGVPLPPTEPGTFPVPSDAPVVLDAPPQRVPSFPRPLEPARPADSIAGTQVYRAPPATARVPGYRPDTTARSEPTTRRDATALSEPAVRTEPTVRSDATAMGAPPARSAVPVHDANPASGTGTGSGMPSGPTGGGSWAAGGSASGGAGMSSSGGGSGSSSSAGSGSTFGGEASSTGSTAQPVGEATGSISAPVE